MCGGDICTEKHKTFNENPNKSNPSGNLCRNIMQTISIWSVMNIIHTYPA